MCHQVDIYIQRDKPQKLNNTEICLLPSQWCFSDPDKAGASPSTDLEIRP